MKCKYNDCGWCYKWSDEGTNTLAGKCRGQDNCSTYEPHQVETLAEREKRIKAADEFNMAASMEPVTVFDATAHSNDEWPDEYQSWSDVPDKLKRIAEVIPEWHLSVEHAKPALYVESCGTWVTATTRTGPREGQFTRAQWQNARALYEQLGDEYQSWSEVPDALKWLAENLA